MKTIVHIQNLKCSGCSNTITKKLNSLDDVSEVTVELEDNSVTFEYSEAHTLDVVKKTLADIGYPEDGEANNLTAKAKSYVSCAFGKLNT